MAIDVNKTSAMVLGGVLVLVGAIGFVNDPILGIFATSLLHNLVHLLTGVVLLAVAFVNGGRHVRHGLLALGVVYGLVTVLGFAAEGTLDSILGGTRGDPAIGVQDHYLHLALGVVLLAIPLIWKDDGPAPHAASA